MFRSIILAAVLLWSGAAFANFEADAATAEWYAVNHECRIGENEAVPLSEAAIAESCERRDHLTTKLQEHAFCWNQPEQEWRKCD